MAAGRAKLLTSVLIVTFAATGQADAAATAAGTEPVAGSTQELARIVTTHEAFPALSARRSPGRIVRPWRPITGGPTVLPVVGRATTEGGVRWLRVMLPGRPNGRSGWITQRGTELTTTSWRLVVKTASRRVLVYRHDRLVRTFTAIVGKPSTPTPEGRFFVEESIRMLPGSAGGPFALALSARSDVLQTFMGGPGQIALHGLANIGGTLGTAVSHGCVRLANRSITWLSARIVPGVSVTITRGDDAAATRQ